MQKTERLQRLCTRLGSDDLKTLRKAVTVPGSPVAIRQPSVGDRFWTILVELGWAEHSHRITNPNSNYQHYTVTRIGAMAIPRMLDRELYGTGARAYPS